MKKRLKEMEEEAAALREMQAKVEREMGAAQGSLHFFFCSFLLIWFNYKLHLCYAPFYFRMSKMLEA